MLCDLDDDVVCIEGNLLFVACQALQGGANTILSDAGDPFAQLDDSMHVVEALCPTYPPRDTFEGAREFKCDAG